MSAKHLIHFLLGDFWVYLLAAAAAVAVGAALLHWSAGLALAVGVVLLMRALGPAFRRLLQAKG